MAIVREIVFALLAALGAVAGSELIVRFVDLLFLIEMQETESRTPRIIFATACQETFQQPARLARVATYRIKP
jgi:hypothetical protein